MNFRLLVDNILNARFQELRRVYHGLWETRYSEYKQRVHFRFGTDLSFKKEQNLNAIRNHWNNNIDRAYFIKLLEQFFKRHPWLEPLKEISSQDFSNSLAYAFIEPIIKTQVIRNFNISDNLDIQLTDLPPLDKKRHQDLLHGWPLLQAYEWTSAKEALPKNFLCRFESNLGAWPPSHNLASYKFTRLDVYRLLFNSFRIDKGRTMVRAMPAVLAQPVELAEIPELDPHSIQETCYWLINLGDSQNTLWILLNRLDRNKKLYIPEEIKDTPLFIKAEPIIRNICPSFTITTVRNECNLQYSHLEAPMVWQYHLFARVLPYCLDISPSNNQTLERYRNNISIFHLIAFVWESLAESGKYRKTNHHSGSISAKLQYTSPLTDQTWFRALASDASPAGQSIKALEAKSILAAIDSNTIQIEPIPGFEHQRRSQIRIEQNNFLQGCYMSCFLPVSRMHLTLTARSNENLPAIPMYIFDRLCKILNHVAFTVEASQLKVGNFPPLVRLSNAAARNRLLESVHKKSMSQMDFADPWNEAGRWILALFQSNEPFQVNTIQEYQSLEKTWRASWFAEDDSAKTQVRAWQLAQFAQMGRLGIDAFFAYIEENYLRNWHAIHQQPKLQIPLLFDLNGDRFITSAQYTEYLGDKLSECIQDLRCSPKFSELHLILPDAANWSIAAIDAIKQLVTRISFFKYQQEEEIKALYLYAFKDKTQEQQNDLLKALLQLATLPQQPLILMIRIPDLDQQISSDRPLNQLKSQYRALQNTILKNQRRHHQAQLKSNSALFEQALKGNLDPMVDIRDQKHLETQGFDGPDECFLLSGSVPGIQQELQQNVEAEHQIVQQVKIERQVYEESEPNITAYSKNFESLLTRRNIDQRKLAPDNQAKPTNLLQSQASQLTGNHSATSNSLSLLFNQWVGSSVDAPHTIQYIEPEAFKKLKDFAANFQMGLVLNHLSFGFYLAHKSSDPSAYILCYEENRAKLEKHQWEGKSKEQRNPFTPHLDTPLAPVSIDGDYRQMTLPDEDDSNQLALWHYAIPKDTNPKLTEEQLKTLRRKTNSHDNNPQRLSTQMSSFEVKESLTVILSYPKLLENLVQWATSILPAQSDSFIKLFIGNFSEKELQSFTQLLYYYDKTGASQLLKLAHQIYLAFGEANFLIWRNAIFNKSSNATELLEKPVQDAIALSLITLKDKSKSYTKLWFTLLETKTNYSGFTRYHRLWFAFQTVIAYMDDRHLRFDEAALAKMFAKFKHFEAQTWLDRLYQFLKMAEGQLYETLAQQSILDNLDSIDWTHHGLYYAMRYQQFPYWFADLKLNAEEINNPEEAYEPLWDKAIEKKHLATQFGRYLAAKLRLHYKEYLHFAKNLSPILASNSMSYPIARLLLIQLCHGNEYILDWQTKAIQELVKTLSNESILQTIAFINSAFRLDNGNRETYRISHRHLLLIPQVLLNFKLQSFGTDLIRIRAILNGLGKSCQYLESHRKLDRNTLNITLIAMLTQGLKDISYLEAMCQSPWLLDGNLPWKAWSISQNPETASRQKRLLKQLESIDYERSSYLPTALEIKEALAELEDNQLTATELDVRRRICIENWIQKGCSINEQDVSFRLLNKSEITQLSNQLNEQLLLEHRTENAPLINQLLPYLALDAGLLQPEMVLNKWIAELKRIDNKPHFNDLGIVLGNIIQHVRKEPSAKISLQQLTDIINSLMRKEHKELEHFPHAILVELLHQCGSKLSSSRFNQLSTEFAPGLKLRVKQLIAADIANPAKTLLLKLLRYPISEKQWFDILNSFAVFDGLAIGLDYQMDLAQCILLLAELDLATLGKQLDSLLFTPTNPEANHIWLKSRRKLLQALNKSKNLSTLNSLELFLLSDKQKRPAIEIIAIHTLGQDNSKATKLYDCLYCLPKTDLEQLAAYCYKPPRPCAEYLIQHLTRLGTKKLIHQFETEDQAKGLRHYSLTEENRSQLLRVLAGIKEKNSGFISDSEQKEIIALLYYANAYAEEQSLASIPSAELKEKLRETAQALQSARDTSTKVNYRIQLISLLRELLVRQSGKWVNHTQMLDLIYAALHHGKPLFHQLKTGQGKSIVTIMRVAFHVLCGKVVDVFTAKESLSSRDHEEIDHILDAIGISHAHVMPNDSELAYQVGDNIYGAVNYMTWGSFSLYQSGHSWSLQTQRYIDFNSKERVAIIDEADQALLDEQTMFNFSYSGDDIGKIYNYDAWVYQASWRYFLSIKDNLQRNEKGIAYLSRQKHLQAFCQYLQQQADYAPVQSSFIESYLSPAISGKKEAILERDKILANLLSAAFAAYNLEDKRDFSVQEETKTLPGGIAITGRAAKVVIHNQLHAEAMFSDGVHQILHVRLNEDAIAKGEPPNFFIAPDSFIALSQHVPSLIRHYYGQIEGCSGTMGDAGDLAVYQARYGVEQVIKLPSHEVPRTHYLGMVFCADQKAYEQAIMDCLEAHQEQPCLLISEDDIAVEALSSSLIKKLSPAIAKRWIKDTNDSGLTEKEVLPEAGKAGAIVNSSRMARGTDIKPETEKGLLVIRAYPDIPRFNKQSGGRQGRNGAKGELIDIIDYSKVFAEYTFYARSEHYKPRIDALMERERVHLTQKLEKHQQANSSHWDWLRSDPNKQNQYLITRVVQYLKREIKIEKEMRLRCKEALVAECSAHLMQQLMEHIGQDQTEMKIVRKQWQRCSQDIDSAWKARMKGATEDNEALFDVFYEKAKAIWQQFAGKYPKLLNAFLLEDKQRLLSPILSMRLAAWNSKTKAIKHPKSRQQSNMSSVIAYYQDWMQRVSPEVAHRLSESQQKLYYGQSPTLFNFFQALSAASQVAEGEKSEKQQLTDSESLFQKLRLLPLPMLSYIPLAHMNELVEVFDSVRGKSHFEAKLACLEQLSQHPCAASVETLCEHHMQTLGKTMQFLANMVCLGYMDKQHPAFRRFTTPEAIGQIADLLWTSYWTQLKPGHFEVFERFINQDISVCQLLSTRLSKDIWLALLGQLIAYNLNQPEDKAYIDSVVAYFKQHQALLNHQYAGSLKALLDIFFHYPHRRIDANQFPAPDCLLQGSLEDRIAMIHFLSEQYMISAEETTTLTDIINKAMGTNQDGAAGMVQNLLPAIESLPANIPFEMILQRVQVFAEQQQQLQGAPQSLQTLNELGQALNAFSQSKGITSPEKSLPEGPEKEGYMQRIQALVLKKDSQNQLRDAIEFLKELATIKYKPLDANTCLQAVEAYDQDCVQVLELLRRARNVMKPAAYHVFRQYCFPKEGDKPELNHLEKRICLFKTNDSLFAIDETQCVAQHELVIQECLSSEGFENLSRAFNLLKQHQLNLDEKLVWEQFRQNLNQKTALEERLQFIEDSKQLDPKLKDATLRLLAENHELARLKEFVRLALKDRGTPDALTAEDFTHILQQWTEGKIIDSPQLQRVIDAQKLANLLSTEKVDNQKLRQDNGQLTYARIFGSYNKQANQSQRFALMHSITHNLIRVSESLLDQCWRCYSQLIGNERIQTQIQRLAKPERALGLNTVLQSIKAYALELSLVRKDCRELHTSGHAPDKDYYFNAIQHAKSQYTGSWCNIFSINRCRRKQAQTMFDQLDNFFDKLNAPNRDSGSVQTDTLYLDILVILQNTQKDIVANDSKQKIKNKKGYSRLFNISQQLGLQICKDILISPGLNPSTVQKAQDWLSQQEQLLLTQLWQRLPYGHKLVGKIQELARSAAEPAVVGRMNAQQAIAELRAEELPTNLRYLLPMLKAHFLTEEPRDDLGAFSGVVRRK